MNSYLLSTALIGAAALTTACGQPKYYANNVDDQKLVCTDDAPVGSRIKRKSCKLTGGAMAERQKELMRYEVLTQGGAAAGPTQGSAAPITAPEGTCGGQRD